MPVQVACKCGKLLYQTDTNVFSVELRYHIQAHIHEQYGGKCPKCGRKIMFPLRMGKDEVFTVYALETKT